MNVKEFVANDKAVDNIKLATEYVPYVEKVAQCKGIVNATQYKNITEDKKIFVADTPTLKLFQTMKLVALYTNIEFEDEKLVEAYDILNKNGILDRLFGEGGIVPEREQVEWKMIMDMTIDDTYENERSQGAIFGGLKESLGMVIGSVLDGMAEAIEEAEKNK